MPTPEAWVDALPGKETVDLVPLVDGKDAGAGPGWCTYPWGFDAPEVEVFCGGQNHKSPDAAAVWRQGFLVHFGFEQGPAQLNEAGRVLLVDTIVYAARCKDDPPITRIESPFRTRSRAALPREKARKYLDDDGVKSWFCGAAEAELMALPAKDREQRFAELEPFLCAVAAERNEFDADATLRAWKVGNRDAAMLDRCVEALRAGGDEAAKAQRTLARYVPEGPGDAATADAWADWVKANRAFVFFSDAGGYRWFVDPLAKARGVPTAELRGTRRLTRS